MHSRLCFALALFAGCGKPPDFTVRPTAGQLYVTHAEPGQTLDALSASGDVVESGVVDAQGSLVLRHLAAGSGWRVRLHGSSPERVTAPLTVTAVDAPPPPQSFYEQQHLVASFNYLTMRDGTTLSAWVTLPPGAGPFPTVIAYAGYAMSRPGQPVSGAEFLCADFPTFCDAPEDPAALFASLFGYATVSVNMRGTGCSGGPYDYFEPLQVLDGYDVVETVAAQSWVRFHRPGMVGLSFPGIAQLFVASAQPPSLAAIAPMSVVESTNSTMRPGGLLNEGFALSWIDAVLSKAAPYGQGWERDRVDSGDDLCRENQLLHSQAVDNIAQARAAVFYDPAQQDHLNPHTFVDRISVPVFLSGSWQDEQTGPYFFRLFDRFTNAPALRLTASNGVHEDGFTPQVLIEWQQFLELFVAKRLPRDPANVRNVSTFIFDSVFHSPLVLPPARFSKYASYDEALAAWKAEPTLRVIFETGGGRAGDPGAPVGTFEHGFTEYPPHEQQPRRLYFKLDGGMDPAAPTEPHAASVFLHDADAGTPHQRRALVGCRREAARLRVACSRARQRGGVRERTLHPGHRAAGHRQLRPLARRRGRRRRPPGLAHRGARRRQRGLPAVGLAARQSAHPRPRRHRHLARPGLPAGRRDRARTRRMGAGAGRHRWPGARPARGLEGARHRRHPRRHAGAVAVRAAALRERHALRHRPRRESPLERGVAGHRRARGTADGTAVPGPAWPTVSGVHPVRQRAGELTAAWRRSRSTKVTPGCTPGTEATCVHSASTSGGKCASPSGTRCANFVRKSVVTSGSAAE